MEEASQWKYAIDWDYSGKRVNKTYEIEYKKETKTP